MKVKKFERSYEGFESISELLNGEHIEWWLERSGLPGDFAGTLKVTITYEEAADE